MTSRDDSLDLRGLVRIQREAVKVACLVSAGQDPDGRYDGHDTSRTVRVTVHGSGRVDDIEIGRTWRDSVGTSGLGSALVGAINDAIRRRLEAWGQAMERASADPVGDESNLLAQLSDNKSFPGRPVGTWPKSTSEDLSDGSWSDSDKSDWQLKY